jgi:apolipoprotein N-acyltransferase
VIDAEGRVTALLPAGEKAVLDASLPQALQPTLYARVGDAMFALLLVLCLAFTFVARYARAPTQRR